MKRASVFPRLVLLLAPVFAQSADAQSTWYVDVSGTPPGNGTQSNPYTSIQFAIDQATTQDGDTVLVAAGTYVERVDFKGKAIVLDGSAASPAPTIDAGGVGSAVTMRTGEGPGSVLRGFRLTGGKGTPINGNLHGGGMFLVGSAPQIQNVRVENNAARFGAGLAAISSAAPTLTGCLIANNDTTAQGSEFSGSGGGMYLNSSNLEFNNSQCNGNRAFAGGGGVLCLSSFLSARNSDFADNKIYTQDGGAINISGSGANAVLEGCDFQGNGALGSSFWGNAGGAVSGPVNAIQCSFAGGRYMNWGGACSEGTYRDCVFMDNVAQNGGALYSGTAVRCTFLNNFAAGESCSGRGGAMYASQALRCMLMNNRACGQGGAAYNSSLVECEVLFNKTEVGEGGISFGGGLMIGSAVRTNFRGNTAQSAGPGAPGLGGAGFNCSFVDCRVSLNTATRGAGIFFSQGNFSTPITGCSFAANVASDAGGAVYSDLGTGGLLAIKDSILWGNLPQAIAAAPNTSFDVTYSIVQGGFPGTGNLSADPLWFRPRGLDLHLMAGSPAIDAGDPTSTFDPDGSRADMGALPFDPNWTGSF